MLIFVIGHASLLIREVDHQKIEVNRRSTISFKDRDICYCHPKKLYQFCAWKRDALKIVSLTKNLLVCGRMGIVTVD
jgi:hypothetical protein